MIDGMAVDSGNTGNGFFRGPVFLHPDLDFQYRFPDGWSTWREPDAAIGLSSVQDAIIRLRVRAGTPPEAAATFFGQPELAAGEISGTAINGLPATTGEFVAENGQGPIRGIATFIACGAATCEVVASAILDAFDTYASEFERSIATFERLNGHGLQAAPIGDGAPAASLPRSSPARAEQRGLVLPD
jgi:predicted Zn-dependent protease